MTEHLLSMCKVLGSRSTVKKLQELKQQLSREMAEQRKSWPGAGAILPAGALGQPSPALGTEPPKACGGKETPRLWELPWALDLSGLGLQLGSPLVRQSWMAHSHTHQGPELCNLQIYS